MKQSVALIGLAGAGKSVFLTSLLDHLKKFDAAKMKLTPRLLVGGRVGGTVGKWITGRDLGSEVVVRRFKHIQAAKGLPEFDYDRYRSALVESARWPGKTTDVATYSCEFERTDWLTKVRFDFLDFPGERFADASMVGLTYEQWSDELLKMYDNDARYADVVSPFIKLARSPGHADGSGTDAAAALVDAYRTTIAKLHMTFHPLISPSTFILDREGKVFDGKNLDTRYVGLAADKQFVPLGEGARAAQAAVAEAFKANYNEYRDALVIPLFKRLASCNQLVVLVDIPEILTMGITSFNEACRIVEVLLAASQPGSDNNRFKWVGNIALFSGLGLLAGIRFFNYVDRVAFVATKADTVRHNEVGRLRSLLQGMVGKLIRDYNVVHDYFTCAAVCSTHPHPSDDSQLYGYPMYRLDGTRYPVPEKGKAETPFTVMSLPEEWPADWDAHEFQFPAVHPRMPRKVTEPPDQEGLGRILDFLMAGKSQEAGS